MHCPKIRSVYMGVSSFGCYSSLLLLDLPSLQSLHLGKFCFECMTKFNIQGMGLNVEEFSYGVDLPSLSEIEFVSFAILNCQQITFSSIFFIPRK